MDNAETELTLQNLEEQIAALPAGYISKKTINGKTRLYHQWTQDGQKKSKYLRPEEAEVLESKIAHRKELQEQLKALKKTMPHTVKPKRDTAEFETAVKTGEALRQFATGVEQWERRDCYSLLRRFLDREPEPRVCLIYGLRRTGKTTMLRQALTEMSEDELQKTAYVKARRTDTMAMMNRDMQRLFDQGYMTVMIDEVTLMDDFISSAALFSDIYAAMGMKIILSGTDSLGFWFALDDELYDRAWTIHTTFIPYREYSRLLGIDSIDEFIRYGGTLRAGETDFEEASLWPVDAAFRDDESTRKYIDTAICRNIQHSLRCYEDGSHFRHLYSLYDAGELTSAINRIIEDMNHRFVLTVLTRDFKSSDLGISAANFRKRPEQDKRITILDEIDVAAVTQRLMDLLDIRNREEQSIGITNAHIVEIKAYLKALDLIVDCPIEDINPGLPQEEHILFAQPGMRYCQAQALVFSLSKDDIFHSLNAEEKEIVCERILEEVRGRLLEDIILLETTKALNKKRYTVCKLRFDRGEFDMLIYDRQEHTCDVFEIKHSQQAVPEQSKHLRDEEKCELTERRFGPIAGKYVLYLGPEQDTPDGIAYRNAESFLKMLPQYQLTPAPTEDETQGFQQTM